MQTLLGEEIPKSMRGILYLCHFDYPTLTLTPFRSYLSTDAGRILDLYANIPNPESQVASGNTYEEFCKDLETLHRNMEDKEWLKELSNCL